jgi:hypothetical protein
VATLLAMASGADEPALRRAILDYAREPHRALASDEARPRSLGIHLVAPEVSASPVTGEAERAPVEASA